MKYRIVQLNNDFYCVEQEDLLGNWFRSSANLITYDDAKEHVNYQKSFEVKKVIEVIE